MPPSGQWIIDAAHAMPSVDFVQAEIVETIQEDDEDRPSFGETMSGMLTMHTVEL